jgi:hypothetical protein
MSVYSAQFFKDHLDALSSQRKEWFRFLFVPAAVLSDDNVVHGKPFKSYNYENALFILHLITAVPLKNPDLRDKAGWIPLMSKRIRETLNVYAPYCELLERTGWIEIDKSYISTEFAETLNTQKRKQGKPSDVEPISMRYRLSPTWSDSPIVPIKVKRNKLWAYRICEQTDDDPFHLIVQNHEFGFLAQWVSEISIDTAASAEFLANLYSTIVDQFTEVGFARRMRTHAIYELCTGSVFFKQDEFGRRIHTNLTNLPSDLRPLLRLKGSPLVNIDLKNSQPMILSGLLRGSVRRDPSSYLEKVGIEQSSKDYEVFLKAIHLLDKIDSPASDISLYCDLVRTGAFYEHFIQRLRNWKDYDPNSTDREEVNKRVKSLTKYRNMDRDGVKEAIMVTFFSSNLFIGRIDADLKNRFAEFFPDVYQVIKTIKTSEKNRLAKFLQRSESMIVLYHACKRLNRMHPDIPILTIHDSICTLPEHKLIVREVLLDEVLKFVGFVPTVKEEIWN